jgi:maltoporin
VAPSTGVQETGNDFRFVLREAYLEMANVFKGAPEITFWGSERFYDRFKDANGYFYLGFRVLVRCEKHRCGHRQTLVAYIASQDASNLSTSMGTLYKHGLDVRLKTSN